MNRVDLQTIAELRIRESRALLNAGFPEGAYYLAGYSVECALKACIAKRTREFDFPEKKLTNDSHTHDLLKLIQLANLKLELDAAVHADANLQARLDTIQDWSEASRYDRKSQQEAADLIDAVEDQTGGLLPWIRQRW